MQNFEFAYGKIILHEIYVTGGVTLGQNYRGLTLKIRVTY